MGFRTPLSRARGLGSAKDGTHHWWMQRVTAVAMIPLCLWIVFSLLDLSMGDLQSVKDWLKSPVSSLLLLGFLAAMTYHAKLGVQVVIEDYVHKPSGKYTLLLINTLGFALLFIMAAMSILTLHLM